MGAGVGSGGAETGAAAAPHVLWRAPSLEETRQARAAAAAAAAATERRRAALVPSSFAELPATDASTPTASALGVATASALGVATASAAAEAGQQPGPSQSRFALAGARLAAAGGVWRGALSAPGVRPLVVALQQAEPAPELLGAGRLETGAHWLQVLPLALQCPNRIALPDLGKFVSQVPDWRSMQEGGEG